MTALWEKPDGNHSSLQEVSQACTPHFKALGSTAQKILSLHLLGAKFPFWFLLIGAESLDSNAKEGQPGWPSQQKLPPPWANGDGSYEDEIVTVMADARHPLCTWHSRPC